MIEPPTYPSPGLPTLAALLGGAGTPADLLATFGQLLDSMPVGCYVTDCRDDLRVVYANRASEAWVSPDRLPVTGKLLEETIEFAQDNGFLEALAAVCISGQPQHLRSFPIPSLNSGNGNRAGESLWDLEAYPLKDAEANVAHVLVCAVEARRAERLPLQVVAGRKPSR